MTLTLGCFLAGSLAISAASAACESCKLADRGNRIEGVRPREQFSSGNFELLAVHYRRASEEPAAGPTVHLSVWLDEPGELDEIKVWQPARNYLMEPARKQYGAGLQDFAWPRGEVIDRIGLSVNALYALVNAGDVYLPALLSAGGDAVPEGGYEFVFDRGAAIGADCTVERRDGEDRVLVREFDCSEDEGGEIPIRWDGRDSSGRPAPDGLYALTINGDLQTEIIRPVKRTFEFRHRGRLE